ncbi:hypothetical protein JL107_14640 [Nakamurella flavida]|uniref:Uncharacterized protein n=1 Tax=Nakamurella flavida TaxID=363630 RepID=A0A938YNA6_9ACTN|nr:hypothetical protein [Nakamurella flavida]MBM9477686.1 hypothetical protein [Nakamurella flavida]MDP9779238.1 hypothetical protein [Nakamurella flavida]
MPGLAAPVLAASVLVLGACADPPPSAPVTPIGSVEITAALDVVNAATGSAAAQRAALASVTDPAGRPALDRCPAATRTVRFQPVLGAVTAAPGFTDAEGHSLPGTAVAVPTLVRVYADGALSTTEITVLHVGLVDGTARLAPLCLG